VPETTPPPFPFLLGCRRSGTTLMRVMFDSNPEMAVPLEAYFPVDPPAAWLGSGGAIDAGAVVSAFERKRWFRKLPLEAGAFRAAVEAGDIRAYPDVVRCFFRTYADAQGKPRYGSKTPRHVILQPQLAAMFPEARFVHIVRDGRDVVLSLLEVDRDMPDLRTAARFWRDRVTRGRADGRRLGAERYTEVRYEDLLDDPEHVLRRLCAFVEMPYDDAMLRYYERIPDMVIGTGVHAKLSQPPTKGLRDWRTQMSPSDVDAFEVIAGDALDAFGYERAGRAPSRTDRLRADVAEHTADARRVVGGWRRRLAGAKGVPHV
jgi:hypothetical protein